VLRRWPAGAPPERKADGSLVTAADLEIQAMLQGELERRWPGIPLLGEEMPGARQAELCVTDRRYWCLDPLDGTTNYVWGVPFHATSLALMEGGRPVVGVVYDPQRQECFSAERGAGAFLDGRPLPERPAPPELRRCLAVIDFKRFAAEQIADLLGRRAWRSQRNFGACALEWCWLAAGRVHLYLHGGMKLWDLGAGSLILEEAGGVGTDPGGGPISYCTPGPIPVLAAATPTLHAAWLEWFGPAGLGG